MKDTAKRIRAYKAALPGLKERLAAVALLLVVSTVMMISATFAWITLSRAPEVTGINTTISGNGNLEIALSDKDGLAPDEFDVDESLTKGVNVTLSNLEWGNLINLSDPSYGIDNLALRPAQLNTANLLGSPLWGAVYAEDGRITTLDSNYAYTMFDETKKEFLVSSDYGVRAISSYVSKLSETDEDKELRVRIAAVTDAQIKVTNAYATVRGSVPNLHSMVSRYAQDKLNTMAGGSLGDNSGKDSLMSPYIKDMITLYETLDAAMVVQQDAYIELANLQLYRNAALTGMGFTPISTWEEVVALNSKANSGVSITELDAFVKDHNQLIKDMNKLKDYQKDFEENGREIYWNHGGDNGYQLSGIVDRLIGFNNSEQNEGMYIDINGRKVYVTNITSDDAFPLLRSNGEYKNVYIVRGILRDFEQRIITESARMKPAKGKQSKADEDQAVIDVNVQSKIGSITIHGVGVTTASGAATFDIDFNNLRGSLVTKDAVAEDTYGMAVDLWVRTNAESTCLTLEGATAADENGNIIRYDGANRIWGRVPSTDTIYTTESTSQGGGSCYIYYADTPEDMARSLDLLDSMKVAFVSQGGSLLATAEMDTVNYCAVNGRVTVPLVLDTNTKTTYTYKDSMNQEVVGKAITTLTYDAAERITAIIYLDGTRLTNDNVLAASEIQGQLNIQFGSSKDLQTIGSNDLIDDVRTVTARVSNTEIDFDTAVTEADRKVTVTVEINGTTATDVQAFFVRAINSTQGSREEEMNFTKQVDGTWTSDYVFTAPGDYYLRYVRLNGVDYALANPLHVTVSGFALKSVTWNQAKDSVVVRTSDGTFSTKVTVEFASNNPNKLPNTVQARFVRTDGNTVNVPLSRGTDGKWTGTGNFTTSGVYKLEYLVYTTSKSTDGIYKDLGDLKKTLDLALGMYVEVKDMTGKLVEDYKSDGVYDKKVEVRIYDNAGNAIEELKDAKLYYSNNGSASNTINSDLTWNAGKYDAILPIKTAGRWMFGYVEMKGGQVLTKASGSPTYTIISPDPVAYDDSSKTTYNTPNGDGIQFVPLTNDATIDGIKLLHADTADVTAVVYNDVTKQYYTVSKDNFNVTSRQLKLPTYTTGVDADGNPDQSTATQDGTWYVAAIILTNCYGEDKAYHGETNPIIWAGTDEISKAYVESQKDTAGFNVTANKDFSKLATKVSGSLNVTFVQSKSTALGGTDVPFMTSFQTNEMGMGVKLTDNAGNVIPASKISDVSLTINYTPPTNDASYGYKVLSGAGNSYTIPLNEQDAETGLRTVSVNSTDSYDVWQYVGPYQVTKLTVTTASGKTAEIAAGANGLPTGYTLTTMGPTVKNLNPTITQSYTEFGKTGANITGTFLESIDKLGITVQPNLVAGDGKSAQYAVLDGLSYKLRLTYQDKKTAPNGGYSWAGTSPYETMTLDMNNNGGYYEAPSATLLAGRYKVELITSISGTETAQDLKDVSAYSKAPTLKVTEVAPAMGTSFTTSIYTGDEVQYYNMAERNGGILNVSNYYDDDSANVYIQAVRSFNSTCNNDLVDYTLPKVTLQISGMDNSPFAGGNMRVRASFGTNCTYEFTSNGQSATNDIGTIGQASWQYQTGTIFGVPQYTTINYETREFFGVQNVNSVTVTLQNVDYSVKLDKDVTIREVDSAPPTITYLSAGEQYTTPSPVASQTGEEMTVTLPTSIGEVVKEEERATKDEPWTKDTTAQKKLTYYVIDKEAKAVETGAKFWIVDTRAYTATVTFGYHKYTRTTLTEKKVTEAQMVSATYGLVGWEIDGKTYQPGDQYVVDGVVTAKPIIGEVKDPIALGQPSTTTLIRTTVTDVYDGYETGTIEKTGLSYSAGAQAAVDTVLALYNDKKPSGYEWFDANKPTYDGHYDEPLVN